MSTRAICGIASSRWLRPRLVTKSRPGRTDQHALAAVRVTRRRVRFPIGRSRQSGAPACIRGSARRLNRDVPETGTESGPVRRPARWQRRAHVRLRSWGASWSMPARAAAARTTSHSTFGDMPSPQTRPALSDRAEHRAARDGGCGGPRVDVVLHPRGIGTVRTCPPLPTRSAITPVLLALLNRLNVQRQLGAA